MTTPTPSPTASLLTARFNAQLAQQWEHVDPSNQADRLASVDEAVRKICANEAERKSGFQIIEDAFARYYELSLTNAVAVLVSCVRNERDASSDALSEAADDAFDARLTLVKTEFTKAWEQRVSKKLPAQCGPESHLLTAERDVQANLRRRQSGNDYWVKKDLRDQVSHQIELVEIRRLTEAATLAAQGSTDAAKSMGDSTSAIKWATYVMVAATFTAAIATALTIDRFRSWTFGPDPDRDVGAMTTDHSAPRCVVPTIASRYLFIDATTVESIAITEALDGSVKGLFTFATSDSVDHHGYTEITGSVSGVDDGQTLNMSIASPLWRVPTAVTGTRTAWGLNVAMAGSKPMAFYPGTNAQYLAAIGALHRSGSTATGYASAHSSSSR